MYSFCRKGKKKLHNCLIAGKNNTKPRSFL